MSRISITDAEKRLDDRANSNYNYVNQFFLTKDKEHNIVKFLLKDIADIEVYSVHVVKMTSKTGKEYSIHVSCLEHNCPMCREAQKYKDQMFPLVSRARDNIYLPLISLYDKDGEVSPEFKVWIRSTKFYRDNFAPTISRYGLDTCYEIERSGAKGAKQIAYNMFAIDKDFDKKPIPFADIDIETLKKDYDVADDSIFGETVRAPAAMVCGTTMAS